MNVPLNERHLCRYDRCHPNHRHTHVCFWNVSSWLLTLTGFIYRTAQAYDFGPVSLQVDTVKTKTEAEGHDPVAKMTGAFDNAAAKFTSSSRLPKTQ